VRTLILARHAHSASNHADVVSCRPPGRGLTVAGRREAEELGTLLAEEPVALGVASELRRTQETLDRALAGRDVPRLVLPELNEIHFGRFEGGPLAAYREWAWANTPSAECPGGGESRSSAAARFAAGLDVLLARGEEVVLAIGHALPVRYVLDAADGRFPAQRVQRVEHAVPYRLERDAVETAAATLRAWAAAPRFADAPSGA
jgi:broad specificity phosphatase PhoE